jgi:hypothetical protein
LTAAHCIPDAATASTLSTRWFYQKAACGTTDDTRLANIGGGVTPVASDRNKDLSLLRLNLPAPATVTALAVQSGPVTAGTGSMGIHHPFGGDKKVNQGMVYGTDTLTFSGIANPMKSYQVSWKTGVTATGSSGSPMLTWDGSKYLVAGTLIGGLSSCQYPAATDMYSVMSDFYPSIAAYVGLSVPAPTTPAITPGRYILNTNDGKAVVMFPFYFHDSLMQPMALVNGPLPWWYASIKWVQVNTHNANDKTVVLSIGGYPVVASLTVGQSAYGPLSNGSATPFVTEPVGQMGNGKTAYRLRLAASATHCLGTSNLGSASLLDKLIQAASSVVQLPVSNGLVSTLCTNSNVLKISFDTQ